MKKVGRTLLAIVVIGLAVPAYAYSPCGPGGKMQERNPEANLDRHLARMKEALGITPDQEGAWSEYAQKAKGEMGQMREAMREARQEMPQTAPQRFDRRIEMMKRRIAFLENMDEAFKRLYGVLTPQQQAAADRHFMMMHRRP